MTRVTVGANPRSLLAGPSLDHSGRSPERSSDRVLFSRAVALLGSGTTWKSTRPARHPLTDGLIDRECVDGTPILLDVGVSDGITSIDLIGRLGRRFGAYYATDVSFHAAAIERDGRLYVYAGDRTCVLVCSKRCLYYADIEGALAPFGSMVRHALAGAPVPSESTLRRMSLINPGLLGIMRSDGRVRTREYSVFDPWPLERARIIKVANVLNRAYFSDDQIRLAIRNLRDALCDGGKLFLTDNRRLEKVSVLARRGETLELRSRHNGGSEITDLALVRS